MPYGPQDLDDLRRRAQHALEQVRTGFQAQPDSQEHDLSSLLTARHAHQAETKTKTPSSIP